mgnify:CR=1 FL=1
MYIVNSSLNIVIAYISQNETYKTWQLYAIQKLFLKQRDIKGLKKGRKYWDEMPWEYCKERNQKGRGDGGGGGSPSW